MEDNIEKLLERLENIVKSLEDGSLSLEESMQLFDEGVEISRVCRDRIDAAQNKIEQRLSPDRRNNEN